jgi:hypothetical protein
LREFQSLHQYPMAPGTLYSRKYLKEVSLLPFLGEQGILQRPACALALTLYSASVWRMTISKSVNVIYELKANPSTLRNLMVIVF